MEIEKHIKIFYITQIILSFILNYFISHINESVTLGFILKLFFLPLISFLLLFIIYAHLTIFICGYKFSAKKNFELDDFILTSSAIVTTFLLNDIVTIIKSIISDDILFLFLFLAGIIIVFEIIHRITFFMAKSL